MMQAHEYGTLSVLYTPRNGGDLADLEQTLNVHPVNSLQAHQADSAGPDEQKVRLYTYRGQTLATVLDVSISQRAIAALGDNVGFFNNVLSRNDADAMKATLDHAKTWLADRGVTRLRGPMSSSLSDKRGVRIDAGTSRASFGLADNPSYYADLLENAGLQPTQDMFSFRLKMTPRAQITLATKYVKSRNPGLSVRQLDTQRIADEVKLIVQIYNAAWRDHWSFIPTTEEDLLATFHAMEEFFDPRMAFFVIDGGQEVGLFIGVPNFIEAMGPDTRQATTVRGMLFGVARTHQRKGIDVVLIEEALSRAQQIGVEESEIGWILESNTHWLSQIRRVFRGSVIDEKRYRIFECSI